MYVCMYVIMYVCMYEKTWMDHGLGWGHFRSLRVMFLNGGREFTDCSFRPIFPNTYCLYTFMYVYENRFEKNRAAPATAT